MKGLAKVCGEIQKAARHRHIICEALQADLWYMFLGKEPDMIQRSSESGSGLETFRQRYWPVFEVESIPLRCTLPWVRKIGYLRFETGKKRMLLIRPSNFRGEGSVGSLGLIS